MISFNNVDKIKDNQQINPSWNCTFDNPLYEEFYEFNKNYYSTKTQYILESLNSPKQSSLGVGKRMLDWMRIGSSGYSRSMNNYNINMSSELNYINMFMKEPEAKPYLEMEYYIKEIKTKIPYIPSDIATKIDRITDIDISDPKLYKKALNKFFYLGQLPQWFYGNNTIESMTSKLNKAMPVSIYDGAYSVRQLAPRLVSVLSELRDRAEQSRQLVKKEARQLDLFADKLNNLKKSRPELVEIFKVYDEVLEIIYGQLTLYQRSVMCIFGEQVINTGETIQKMFDDITLLRSQYKN